MACTPEFIEFVCTELSPLGEVSARKMMGDYIIYVNGKCVITACDNTAFVKKLPCIAGPMPRPGVLIREQKRVISSISATVIKR